MENSRDEYIVGDIYRSILQLLQYAVTDEQCRKIAKLENLLMELADSFRETNQRDNSGIESGTKDGFGVCSICNRHKNIVIMVKGQIDTRYCHDCLTARRAVLNVLPMVCGRFKKAGCRNCPVIEYCSHKRFNNGQT